MKKPTPKLRFAVLATDVAIFTLEDEELKVLLIRVHRPPFFINKWGLPGGLIRPQETAEQAAKRILRTKGGVGNTYLEQLYTFSGVKRDPRGRVVSVAYLALIAPHQIKHHNESEIQWISVDKLPRLAYDHNEIVEVAVERLKAKLEYTNIVCNLLAREFALSDLQRVYEVILRRKIDKRNFRKKILALKVVKRLRKKRRGEANRPAELYVCRNKKPQIIEIL